MWGRVVGGGKQVSSVMRTARSGSGPGLTPRVGPSSVWPWTPPQGVHSAMPWPGPSDLPLRSGPDPGPQGPGLTLRQSRLQSLATIFLAVIYYKLFILI